MSAAIYVRIMSRRHPVRGFGTTCWEMHTRNWKSTTSSRGIFRKASEKYGLKVYLCKYHHTGDINGSSGAVHSNPNTGADLWLKKRAQYAWERKYAKHLHESEEANEEFRDVFGKSYL